MGDQKDARLGTLAVQAGLITEAELEELLLEQERRAKLGSPVKFGELMVESGYVTRRQLERLLSAQVAATAKVSRIGPYHLLAKLGEGGMGAVYQARDLRTGEYVALKVLPRSKARDPEFLARFEAEARAIFELDHPNIVKAVGMGEADGYHYLALEYIEGRDVYDILEEKGRIPEQEALSIIIQITQALEHAYEENVVHRDIKPGNILVDKHGLAKLTDFGLALDRERLMGGRITEGTEALGTPFYLSPEQARGEKDIDIRSDIYSLGATLYEMVTGHPPFEGSPAEVLSKHLSQQIPSPRDIDRTLSPGLCHIIEKMMAKRREDRYQTPRELMKDLMLVYQGKNPATERLPSERTSVRPSLRPVRRRSAMVVPTPRSPTAPYEAASGLDQGQEVKDVPGGGFSPRIKRLRRPFLRRAVAPIYIVAFVSLAVALTSMVLLFWWRGGARTTWPLPDSLVFASDFESGTTEGWNGFVSADAAAEGAWGLKAVPAAPPATGLAAVTHHVSFVAGRQLRIGFRYYTDARGPLVVELIERGGTDHFRYVIPEPTRGAWASSDISAEGFTTELGLPGRSFAGKVFEGLAISAPEATAQNVLALDSVWIATTPRSGR